MDKKYYQTKGTFVRPGRFVTSMLYEPTELTPNSHIGLVCLHSHGNYMGFIAGEEMAKRGYRILCSSTKGEGETLEDKMLTVKVNVEYMRALDGIDTVLILSHSGGCTLMSAYETAAENGCGIYQGKKQIIPMRELGALPAGDGVIFLDSNWGNAIVTLQSTNPAITDEESGRGLDPEYDLMSSANGYNPDDPLGSDYSREFIEKYLLAMQERHKRIVDRALDRLYLIERGLGKFEDDEPFFVSCASPTAPVKIHAMDLRLMCRTKDAHDLIHADGSITHEIVHALRKRPPQRGTPSSGLKYGMAGLNTTVKSFLTNYAIRTNGLMNMTADSFTGADYDSTFAATAGNVRHMKKPTLLIGMSGAQCVLSKEHIFNNLAAEDKTLIYVEGATHMFTPNHDVEAFPGQFGDTVKLTFDYVDKWISERTFR